MLLFCFPAFAFGQGYQVYLQGQVQQGMGGAGIAFMKDASALFYNPGGASFVPRNNVQASVSGVVSHIRFLDAPTNTVYETKSPIGTPFALYALFELKDSSKLKFGYCIYTPFGSTVKWEDNWVGRFSLTKIKIMAIFIQPTVSYKINDKIGVGAGFVYAAGSVNLQKDIPVVDKDGNFGNADLTGKANGMGFNLGLYLKPTKNFSIGLTYRSQVNMKVKDGDASFKVPVSLQTNFPTEKFQASLPMPQIASIGLAYKATDKLRLAFDVNYAGWKAYDSLKIDFANDSVSITDIRSARMYKNTVSLRLGAEYMILKKLAARIGIAYAQSPVPDGYVSPETPDGNRISYTAGVGYDVTENFGLNASFQYIAYKREKTTNIETNLSGSYKAILVIPGVSIFFKF